MIVDFNDARNALCRDADRFPLLIGLSITPQVHNSVRNRHAQIVRVRPGLLLQLGKQLLLESSASGRGDFELRPGAGDHLDQIGTG